MYIVAGHLTLLYHLEYKLVLLQRDQHSAFLGGLLATGKASLVMQECGLVVAVVPQERLAILGWGAQAGKDPVMQE